MEDKEKVTEPVVDETIKSEDKTLEAFKGTNQDVANMIAKAKKEAIEGVLKDDLGVEDVKSAKDGLKKFREMQDAQKTDLQKAQEEAESWKTKYSTLESQFKEKELDENLTNTLKDLEVDTNKKGLVKKLIDTTDLFTDKGLNIDELKSRISKVIDEELPELKGTVEKIGVEKQDETYQRKGDSQFLEAYNRLKNKK